MDKEQLHKLCGCSTTELNRSIKTVQTTSEKKIVALKNESTKVARPSRRRKGQEEEDDQDDQEGNETEENSSSKSKGKGKASNKGKKRKASEITNQPEPAKRIIKPISGIVSMIDYMDYQKTKTFKDYKKWRSNLIDELGSKDVIPLF